MRLAAVNSLAAIASAETLPFLLDLMDDSDAAIAAAAAEAVSEINGRLKSSAAAVLNPTPDH